MRVHSWLLPIGCVLVLAACAETKQPTAQATPAAATSTSSGTTTPPATEALYVYFKSNSSRLNGDAEQIADQAARLYREGNPHVMLVVGHTDATGDELYNLYLSARRAEAVKRALAARGIPAQTLEIRAVGTSEPTGAGGAGGEDPQERRAVITWR
jgi:outer membrane protein OmpA-like peptidoglycan-associated protein